MKREQKRKSEKRKKDRRKSEKSREKRGGGSGKTENVRKEEKKLGK